MVPAVYYRTSRREAGFRSRIRAILIGLIGLAVVSSANAQTPDEPSSTTTEEQSRKAPRGHAESSRLKRLSDRLESRLAKKSKTTWHPWFQSAYAGGGFTLGAGRMFSVGSHNTIDVRGSYSVKGYKRAEVEFRAPRVLHGRGELTMLGGWREATQVGFYGLGTAPTSLGNRANFAFRQPYASAALAVRPLSKHVVFGAGIEVTRWSQRDAGGEFPSVHEVYTAATLPGLEAHPTYLHTQGSVAYDRRPHADYARRGGVYGITAHSYADGDGGYGFQLLEYDAVQHIPVLRDASVLSFHANVQTTSTGAGETIPFFMLPSLGGGSSLRGFNSWRFRERHSVLLQAEWRLIAHRLLDAAVFYDAGKAVARRSNLNLSGLKSDYGIGFRVHGPEATVLRIELAHSNERQLQVVFAAKAAF
jgi:outer membrane protein assembly factor BamA